MDLVRTPVGESVEVIRSHDQQLYFVGNFRLLLADQILQIDVSTLIALAGLQVHKSCCRGGRHFAAQGGDQLAVFLHQFQGRLRIGHQAGHTDLRIGRQLSTHGVQCDLVFVGELFFDLHAQFVAQGIDEKIGDPFPGFECRRDDLREDLTVPHHLPAADRPSFGDDQPYKLGLQRFDRAEIRGPCTCDQRVETVVIALPLTDGLLHLAMMAV